MKTDVIPAIYVGHITCVRGHVGELISSNVPSLRFILVQTQPGCKPAVFPSCVHCPPIKRAHPWHTVKKAYRETCFYFRGGCTLCATSHKATLQAMSPGQTVSLPWAESPAQLGMTETWTTFKQLLHPKNMILTLSGRELAAPIVIL